ncbi:MAG TPA: ATPase [Croceibacterium sp.]|nr:ATPase [Croceibacterium sp.]
MADRKNLVAIGPEAHGDEQAAHAPEPAPFEEPTAQDEAWLDEPEPRARGFGWIVPALAVLAMLGWTGFFGWVHQRAILAGASPAQWSQWVVDWAVPVLLVVALWLLAMRHSRREAARFTDAAQALSQESALLERRLTTVNRELSLARDFIAAQSRDLESLGRVASERISEHADRLQGLIRDNGAQVEAIGRVSSTALENMDRLRDDLPVISNSARDVASQIGHAGVVAKDQIEELVAGFNRLNQFGEASGRQVASLRAKVDEALAAFEAQAAQLDEIAGNRFAALAERSAAFRAELDGREVEAFAAIRRRADALAQELDARTHELERGEAAALDALQQRMAQLRDEGARIAETVRGGETEAAEAWSAAVAGLEERMLEAIRRIAEVDQHAMDNARQRLLALGEEAQRVDETMVERSDAFHDHLLRRTADAAEHEAASLAALKERLATFDAQVVERQEEHLAHLSGLAERGDGLARRLAELSAEMDRLSTQGRRTQDDLAESAAGLAARLAESQALIVDSGTRVARLTDDSVRLLELIRSSAEHGNTDLPQALGQAERRLSAFEQQAQALHALIADAGDKGAALAGHVESARHNGTATLEQLAALEQRLAELAQGSEALAGQARSELADAIATLEQASREVLTGLQDRQGEAIRAIAERIAGDSSEAIDRAVRAHAASAIAELEAAAEQAGEAGRDTAIALRDQLAAVNELAGNLERRVAHARQRAEEQVDNDFARRMALITESLNSSAIDISKAFANDVTDTAWASYLRGDRGIFTRRAVRLLDTQEARAVAEIYEADGDFRETVNRYIHDFEAMLRSVLSTRDGHALAVTLLSSDMGKLYVALAQAIERLRA